MGLDRRQEPPSKAGVGREGGLVGEVVCRYSESAAQFGWGWVGRESAAALGGDSSLLCENFYLSY